MNMPAEILDLKGLKCPQPILKIGARAPKIPEGAILEVVADCHTFENDLRNWCVRLEKTLLWLRQEGNNVIRAQIQF
jgi:tRNA 2-thiouridine synthesizing protein A